MAEYVVIAFLPVDTAVIDAEDAESAIEMYEIPEEFRNRDIFIEATEGETFYEMMQAGVANAGLSGLSATQDE